MRIKQDGMLKLCGVKKLTVEEQAPSHGKGRNFQAKSEDENSFLRWRVFDDRVNSIWFLVPSDRVTNEVNQRNAFIMSALVRAAMPGWRDGFAWLVTSLRGLKGSERVTHVGDGAVVSLDRLVRGKIRMMLTGK